MKSIKSILSILFVLTTLTLSSYSQTGGNLIVLVKYKAQTGKDSLALSELKTLVAKVMKEPHYVHIVIHVDPIDKSKILLYEEWAKEDYYKGDHMKTTHLQQFITDSRSFLAAPPEITFWKIYQ